jgi:transglutaminase-like putative cysteine protease
LVSERGANDFRERARVEADRYGPDPWIFVRELLQNARDAGASAVVIEVDERDGITRIRCRDDGEGMSYEHARRYLFSLYASSKEARRNQVGRFGVGFWSILRFDPERIVIRSCPRASNHGAQESAWQVVLDGELQHAERADVVLGPGTEILLERPRLDGADERRVFEAAQQNARFLCMRDAPERPLPIAVNGRLVNAEFALAPPSSAFRRGHVRGVVGLGSAPRVELFSRGLRVRSAACLDDLLSNTGHTSHSRVRFPELPGGLAPQALLESDGLDLLLSRSDARDTRTLRRLVKYGQDELRWLVERQLARIRPPGLGERMAAMLRLLAGESTWWRAVLGAVTGAVLAVLLAKLLWPDSTSALWSGAARSNTAAIGEAGDRSRYGDLRKRYHGPQVSELDPAAAEPLALLYAPAQERPYFAALIIEQVSGDAGATAPLTDERYPGQRCASDCIDVTLPLSASAGTTLPLPIPSGHRLDVESLEFVTEDSEDAIGRSVFAGPKRVLSSAAGEPVLVLDWSFQGTLRYSTGPGPALHTPPRTGSGATLPDDLRAQAEALGKLALDERVGAAIELVRAHVRYETSSEVAALHARAVAEGRDFVTRTLEIGAGDCDVQNGLLVAILHAAGVDARLAVGWVGHRGRVSAWLHAWVEFLDDDGTWRVADATARANGGSSVAGLPPPPDEVVAGINDRPTPGPQGVPSESPAPLSVGIDERDDDPLLPITTGTQTAAPTNDGIRLPPTLIAALSQPWIPWLAGGSGVLGALLLGASLSRRTARRFNLDEQADLSSLLQGALAQPAAFRHLPSLFHRRLIPLRGGSAISLNRARTLASEGRLYSGREQTELSTRARRAGAVVLDAEAPEGRTVAASLGAIDLDRWGHRLARATDVWALAAVSAYLREHDERWRCAALRGLGERVATLDLRPLLPSLSRRVDDRLVLVDTDDPWLQEAERLQASRPHTAVFALLDHLLDHLDLGAERRARLLAPLAERALNEAARAIPAGGRDV